MRTVESASAVVPSIVDPPTTPSKPLDSDAVSVATCSSQNWARPDMSHETEQFKETLLNGLIATVTECGGPYQYLSKHLELDIDGNPGPNSTMLRNKFATHMMEAHCSKTDVYILSLDAE